MSDLLERCHIDKGTYTDGPVKTADVRKLFARIAELEGALQLSHDISNGFSIAMIAAEAELAALREASRVAVADYNRWVVGEYGAVDGLDALEVLLESSGDK